ncbi:MAG: lipocalin family protein [Planctomycetota bacterium]|nr:lipocalin family protein [Planctomycetota bacterium]
MNAGRILLLAACLFPALSLTAQSLDAEGFLRAGPGRTLELPADHASHPETRTEWWYLTGPLTDSEGREYGFQATWFRRALTLRASERASSMGVRDVMLFHGALTDLSTGRLLHAEATTRAWQPWGGASTETLDVSVFENSLSSLPSEEGRTGSLFFDVEGTQVALQLDLAASPVLFHGEEPGLSIKGHEPGQSSWYYTLPAIPVRGTLQFPDGSSRAVNGRAWMDHEFGSSQLSGGQVGWDWFSVVLNDDTALMLYQLRLQDGSADSTSSGTWAAPKAESLHLGQEAFDVEILGSWTSPESGATYPSGWRLSVPGQQLELVVTPRLKEQELITKSTGVTYWEGLCRFEGTRKGEPVAGEGYVELVGYADSISDRFAPGSP